MPFFVQVKFGAGFVHGGLEGGAEGAEDGGADGGGPPIVIWNDLVFAPAWFVTSSSIVYVPSAP